MNNKEFRTGRVDLAWYAVTVLLVGSHRLVSVDTQRAYQRDDYTAKWMAELGPPYEVTLRPHTVPSSVSVSPPANPVQRLLRSSGIFVISRLNSQVSSLGLLFRSLDSHPLNGTSAMMVSEMLAAYFDESGTHDSSVITSVAGFVSTPERWQHFNKEWKRVLDHWGLKYFHMKECAHYSGDFARFKTDELGRKQLLWCLAFLICRHCLYGCAVSVVRKDHEMLNADPRIGSAYKLAAQACVALADKWMGSQQRAGPMSVLLEDGCRYSKDFLDQLENLERPLGTLSRFGNFALGSKRQFPALQAADFLAYEQSKYFTDCLKTETAVPLRKTLELLRIATPHDWKLLHLENIAELLINLALSDVMSLDRETLLKLDPDAVIDEDWQPLTRVDI